MGAMSPRSARVARRQAETRVRIVEVAARRFAAEGIAEVRLDAIADEADVARGTLYKHFPSKESLVVAIMTPVLARALEGARGLARRGPRRGVDALLRLYLELWAKHADALRVSHSVHPLPAALRPLHEGFLREVLALLERCAEARILRCGDGRLAAMIVGRLAVPLLELSAGRAQGEALFVDELRALLLSDPR